MIHKLVLWLIAVVLIYEAFRQCLIPYTLLKPLFDEETAKSLLAGAKMRRFTEYGTPVENTVRMV